MSTTMSAEPSGEYGYAPPPDKFTIDIMFAAMADAMRSVLEAGATSALVRKLREQLVLLCQSYMAAATPRRS